MSSLKEKILAMLGAELDARPVWGEVPALYAIRLSEPPRVPNLSQVPVPDELWATAPGWRTADILSTVALRFAANAPALEGTMHDVYGVAFRAEGNGMISLEPGTAETSEAMVAARAHTIAQQPGSRELRFMLAVDRAGRTYQCLHPRDGEPLDVISEASPAGFPRAETAGAFVRSLDAIMCAITGRDMPERRPDW